MQQTTQRVDEAVRERDEFAAWLDHGIERSQQWFFAQQRPEGFWQAPLEANVAMDAQYIVFNRFMGREVPDAERRLVEHMIVTQSPDGSWSLYAGGPGNLSATIEAYFALKLRGRSPQETPMRRAREFILTQGGLAKAGVFTRILLSYFGQFPAAGVPAMPAELVLLPAWCPLNIYAMSSWARGTVVPLTVIMAHRPSVGLAPGEGIEELWVAPPAPSDLAFAPSGEWFSWRNLFLAVERGLQLAGHSPWKPLRARALRRAEEWILAHQDSNGGWGGIQPAMINSVMALHVLGYANDHPAVRKGLQAIDDFLIEDGGQLLFQPCVSPTWDTALAGKALLDSGVEADHPALVGAAEWLIDQQIFKPGDWSVYNPSLEPGGWAFEFANDWYPDVDDSAVILMVLKRIAAEGPRKDRAIAYGLNWTLGMQSRSGGWGAFDTDNETEVFNQIPFADMEAMIDPPTEDLTGRVLELMGTYGYDLGSHRAQRGRDFLLRTQRRDGSWWGRWGANFIYGTWSALSGLRAIGEDLDAPHVRRAVNWLKGRQTAEGGWGESLRSYDDGSGAGRGEPTASQTAWALLGLLAGERGLSPEVFRGVSYLLHTQRADGSWDEPAFTGTGFPRHFYLRYAMYKDYFPLMALGRFRVRLAEQRAEPARGHSQPRRLRALNIAPVFARRDGGAGLEQRGA